MKHKINWFAVIIIAISLQSILTIPLLSDYASAVFQADEGTFGFIAGIETAGAALASFLIFLFPALRSRRILTYASSVIVGASIYCLWLTDLTVFLIVRFIIGACAGTLCSIALYLVSYSKEPVRDMGIAMAVQALALIATYIIVPQLSLFADNAFLIIMAAWFSSCAAVGWLTPKEQFIDATTPNTTLRNTANSSESKKFSLPTYWFFSAVILLYSCHGAYNVFITEIALIHNISLIETGWSLSAGSIAGFLAGILAGANPRFITPLTALAIVLLTMLLGASLLLTDQVSLTRLITSVIFYEFGWTYAFPYIMLTAARLNDKGDAPSAILFLLGIGMSMGAVFVGQLAEEVGIAIALNTWIAVVGTVAIIVMVKVGKFYTFHVRNNKISL